MATGKTKRAPKTSNGTARNRKNPQTPLALVLMNKGVYRNIGKVIKGK